MTDNRWFNQDLPPEGDQRMFVEKLQDLASGWRFDDLRPTNTHNSAWLGEATRLVDVDVPGLTCEEKTLRVLYTPDSRDVPLLQSEWGGEYMFDGPEDASGLFVSGVAASAEQCALWTGEWLERQLRRPVVRREWDRPVSGASRLLPAHSKSVAVVEWWFSDTEEMLSTTGSLAWSWLTKKSPSRQIVERPDRNHAP